MPEKSFEYRIPITNRPGTYWFHAHYQLQSQSVFGAFVIDESDGAALPFAYDDERIVMLSDWFHQSDVEQLMGLTTPIPGFKWYACRWVVDVQDRRSAKFIGEWQGSLQLHDRGACLRLIQGAVRLDRGGTVKDVSPSNHWRNFAVLFDVQYRRSSHDHY
jgi:FtsP/CotA-like multicopper oxidase with cupredoxin domain